MSALEFELHAELRNRFGKGENRRLRRAGKVPAIIYGSGAPMPITLNHNEILRRLEHEAFYSHVLNIQVGDKTERAILKDIHRHPAKAGVMHMDLQRVDASHKIHIRVPLHFINEAIAPGVKVGGGRVSHLLSSLEVECLADQLPEYIEVDLSTMEMGHTIHLSHLQLPAGVSVRLVGKDDRPVVTIEAPRVADAESAPAAAAPAPAAVKASAKAPAAKAPPQAPAKAPAAAKAPAKAPGKKS